MTKSVARATELREHLLQSAPLCAEASLDFAGVGAEIDAVESFGKSLGELFPRAGHPRVPGRRPFRERRRKRIVFTRNVVAQFRKTITVTVCSSAFDMRLGTAEL